MKKKSEMAFTGIMMLSKHWSSVFSVLEIRRRPLKVGIHEDILAALPEIDKRVLGYALGAYCINPFYLGNCVTGAVRIDLDGAAAGTVTQEQAALAAVKFAAVTAKRLKRRAARAKLRLEASLVPASAPPAPPPPDSSPKPSLQMSLAGLRAAAQQRRATVESNHR